MAYNLQSLITILQQILNPQQTRWILDHNKQKLESLLKKAESLQQILETSSLPKIEILESQIQDASHKAEDIIESYMVDQMVLRAGGVSFTFSPPDLQQVMQELNSAMEQVVELVEGKNMLSSSSSIRASFSSSKSVVVGVDADLTKLKDRLAGMQRKLEIIPIVGMGGIGKTTLARKLYQDLLIVERFGYLAWTTISQDYNMKAILSSLLSCITGKEFDDKHIHKENDELKDILYKSLYGRRYMIVLDDLWSTQVWDEIWKYFPDNNNGSRIVITTRESDVAKYVDSRSDLHHHVQLLNESNSWNLLCQIVFGEDDCSDHVFQEIGRKIASGCGGLPLAITVIGGLLSKLERSYDIWENIAKDVRAGIAETDDCSSILSISYNHLSNHLKPCFLYMGAFPEDYEIKTSRLVRMWVAEGFIRTNDDKSLEEGAEDYLKALVERNLLLVRQFSLNGKPKKRYYMHDLLRDVCMRIIDKDKFLHVVKNGREVPFTRPARRLSVDTSHGMEDVYASTEFMSLARSFIRTDYILEWDQILSPCFFLLRLLRVLDIQEMKLNDFPREIFDLVNLRYLNVSCSSSIPAGISRLWNLQTLIVNSTFGSLPYEIWEMSELRHVRFNFMIWIRDEYIMKCVQEKLQTISKVKLTHSLIRSGFFESIPNIKKLEIYCDTYLYLSNAVDLSHLHKLETLSCSSCLYGGDGSYFLPTLTFPHNLRKLTLYGCRIFASVLRGLFALLNLERLSIWQCSFQSMEWEAREGDEFRSLQFLSIVGSDLVRWRGDETNFPRLRHLLLRDCWDLEEIPSGFGEIPTLQIIEMENCSASSVASAQQILVVQQSEFENYDIKLLTKLTMSDRPEPDYLSF